MSLISRLPLTRPEKIATDLTGSDIRDVDFSLYDLFVGAVRNGQPLVQGKTITGCRIHGPGVLLASTGTTFEDVNFGDSRGGMGNLLMKPMGDKAIGAVPVRDCAFVSCEFYGVSFTGPDDFLEQMMGVATRIVDPQ